MSDYSGHVEPSGPAISRRVDLRSTFVEVRKFSVGPMDNNVYVLRDERSDAALIIDAANEADRVLEEVRGLDVVGIVTTHGHGDHWQALGQVADATGAPVWLHRGDLEMLPRQPDHPADDGAVVPFGHAEVRVLSTPGHTPGSICLLLGDNHLFTGDTLFPGGPGNTFGSAEAFAEIMDSLEQRIFGQLGDEAWIYPGHGDDTTLGAERPSLEEWRARGW